MDKIIPTIFILLVLSIGLYLLYLNGYLLINSKTAVMYIGTMYGRKASFTSCSGYTKRVVRFKESGTIQFDFHSELVQGEVTVELLDSSKQKIMCLNSVSKSTSVHVEKKMRYYLVFRFKSATGNYILQWEQVK